MNKTLTALYDSFYTPPQAANIREEIKTIHKQLILKLDKPEPAAGTPADRCQRPSGRGDIHG